MRENRLSGSEGGGAETNRFFLPLYIASQLMINRRSATEEMLSHLFLKNYNRRANSERHYVTGAD